MGVVDWKLRIEAQRPEIYMIAVHMQFVESVRENADFSTARARGTGEAPPEHAVDVPSFAALVAPDVFRVIHYFFLVFPAGKLRFYKFCEIFPGVNALFSLFEHCGSRS